MATSSFLFGLVCWGRGFKGEGGEGVLGFFVVMVWSLLVSLLNTPISVITQMAEATNEGSVVHTVEDF